MFVQRFSVVALAVVVVLAGSALRAPFSVAAQTPFVEQQKLTADAAEGTAFDSFGLGVAVSGNTAVAGAINFNHLRGAVFVFERSESPSGPVWTRQQRLDGPAEASYFGVSTAIDGDTLVVGAPLTAGRGTIHVFVRSGSVWINQANLKPSNWDNEDWFGYAVAISGDTIVAGAWGDDFPGDNFDQGSVYVFVRNGSTWTEQAHLIASDGGPFDIFGFSVGISGDTVVAGAPSDNSAYVFTRNGTTWTEQQKLIPPEAVSGFGAAAAIDADTLVVGTNQIEVGAGRAYVFTRSGATWSPQQTLTGTDSFGTAVGISGDHVVVGAWRERIGGIDQQGAGYVFARSGTTWTARAQLAASDAAARDGFGVSVAISGATVVAGAFQDDIESNIDQGSAYVFVAEPAVSCATDVTNLLDIRPLHIRFDHKTGHYVERVRLKNISSETIEGPLSLVFDGLGSNVAPINPTGVTNCVVPIGSPFIDVNIGSHNLFGPKARVTLDVEFAAPAGQTITYVPRALAGHGER